MTSSAVETRGTVIGTPSSTLLFVIQEDKLSKVVVKYEAAIKEVDVRLSASGGDASKGPKKQKTEITIYTLRNGIVSPDAHLCINTISQSRKHPSLLWQNESHVLVNWARTRSLAAV